MLLFFAIINLIPLPPGTSAFLGLPLLIVSAQMVYGSKRVWLPRVLTKRTVSAETFRSIMDWIIPRLVSIERMIRPRYWPFWRRRGDRVIGIIALILAIIVTLPIPLGQLAAGILDRACSVSRCPSATASCSRSGARSAWSPWRSSPSSSGLSSPQRLRCSTSCSSCSAAIPRGSVQSAIIVF